MADFLEMIFLPSGNLTIFFMRNALQSDTRKPDGQISAPVLFMIFNRPWETRKTLASIREVRPRQLYIACDGPRRTKPGERETVEHLRKEVLHQIDWPCDVKTLFRTENLGCKQAVIGAITWFFSEVEEGIILEDDCVPVPSFFWFCEILLDRYKNDTRIWHITGDNFQQQPISENADYFYSKYPHIWGWATWRSRWLAYDGDLTLFSAEQAEKIFKTTFGHRFLVDYWVKIMKRIHAGEVDTWDYQWMYTVWKNKGLTVAPNKNLITNIGFNQLATHTRNETPGLSNLKAEDIPIPLRHPSFVSPDIQADEWIGRNLYREPSTMERVIHKIRVLLKPKLQAAIT
jgi:hypothetical protein